MTLRYPTIGNGYVPKKDLKVNLATIANKKRGLKAYNSNWSHKNNADPM